MILLMIQNFDLNLKPILIESEFLNNKGLINTFNDLNSYQ
jgi:hypothetical protein